MLLVAAATASNAGTASAGAPPVNATGTVSCNSVSGSLKFGQALNLTGGSTETIKVKLMLDGCEATGTNVTSSVFSGKAKGSLSLPTNNCTILNNTNSASGSLLIKWSAKAGLAKVNPSSLSFTSLTGTPTGGNGDAGFVFSNQALSGSFAGGLRGEIDSGQTAMAIDGATGCGAPKGVKKLAIAAGHISPPPVSCLVAHSNGVGQTYSDCLPLGTYNALTATEAATAYAASVGLPASDVSDGWGCAADPSINAVGISTDGSTAIDYLWVYTGNEKGWVVPPSGCTEQVGTWN
ncbi:MAG: hypothetical protein WB565_16340 [Acidimicrobiales bacterium]